MIRISPIRVIDQHQEQLGVLPTYEALGLAREVGLDLVEVSPTEKPPVCRIMDYGKHVYEKKKRLKVAQAGHTTTLKEIRMRPKTDPHDRLIKMNRAIRFLGEGNKVQFTMLFRGRERFHRDRARDAFLAILAELGDTVRVERDPSMEGRRMTMVVSPVKQATKPPKKKPDAAGSRKKPATVTPTKTPEAETPEMAPESKNPETVPPTKTPDAKAPEAATPTQTPETLPEAKKPESSEV